MKLADIRIEILVRNSAFVIEVDHFLQSLEPAVVHVRRGVLDLPQRGYLENTPIARIFGNGVTAEIRVRLVGSDSQVGVGVQGEIRVFMTAIAFGVVEEY